METDNRKAKILAGAQKEVADAPEESMEDWFNRGVGEAPGPRQPLRNNYSLPSPW